MGDEVVTLCNCGRVNMKMGTEVRTKTGVHRSNICLLKETKIEETVVPEPALIHQLTIEQRLDVVEASLKRLKNSIHDLRNVVQARMLEDDGR
jgi:hypothetical protein